MIRSAPRTYCSVRLHIVDDAVHLNRGDEVHVWVRERALLADDLPYEFTHRVTDAEARSGTVDLI